MENADNKLTDGLWALLNETFECILLAEPNPWRVKYANWSAAQRFEALPHELVGREIAAFFMDLSKDQIICQLDETLRGECRRYGPSLTLLQTPIPYSDVAQVKCVRLTLDGAALVGVLMDDTLSPQMDALTPLRDRNYLYARLIRLFTHSAERFAILFIDLDGFKRVNDRHGHLIGDRVLYEAAERFLVCVGLANPVTRYGGDEFVVLAENVDTGEDVEALASRIREAIALPISVPDGEVVLSASIGIAISSPEYRTPKDLIAAADRAMYAAKRGK